MRCQSEEDRVTAIQQINRDKTTENPIQKHYKCSSSCIKKANIEDPSLWTKRRYTTNNKIYTQHRNTVGASNMPKTTIEIIKNTKINE